MIDQTQVLLTQLINEVQSLKAEIHQLQADRYPRTIGMQEACHIIGVGRTTLSKRLAQGYYPYAFRENGQWRFPLAELQRNLTAATL